MTHVERNPPEGKEAWNRGDLKDVEVVHCN